TSLPAYFVRGAGSGQRPTVVLFDGMDNAKEMSVIFAGLDFAKRGINTLAIDGPGQAEALRLRNIHSRHDYEVAGTAAYDYVASRSESIPSASRSWATASAAITRRALPPSRSATPPRSRSVPCIGTFMIGSPATRPSSRPIRARAPPRSSNSAGWWARPTTRPRSNGRRSSRSEVRPRRRRRRRVIQWDSGSAGNAPANATKRRIMRNRFRWWSIVAAVLGTAISAQAQSPSSYPDRPIRLVVAFPPGGPTATFARQITQELGEALGQSVVIENKPGAGGYIAWNYVAASDPDGYTLLMAENAIGISQALYKKTSSSFDPVKQYDAIATAATSPLV